MEPNKTELKIVRYRNLSPWLKLAVVWSLIQLGITVFSILIYALIGLASV